MDMHPNKFCRSPLSVPLFVAFLRFIPKVDRVSNYSVKYYMKNLIGLSSFVICSIR